MDFIIKLLAFIGGFGIFLCVVFLSEILYDDIIDRVRESKRKYQIKHRFDKPPKAKCYCVDCVYYDPIDSRTGLCSLSNGKAIMDDRFCAMASPARNSRR